MNSAEELKALMLREPKLTLAVAESLTAGHLQARVASVSGASEYFLGGITAYALSQKVKHLGVVRETAEPVNSVSAEVAEQMAQGICRLFGSDFGVATTGYAEPATAQNVEQPFAWWAIASRAADGKFSTLSGRVDCPHATRIEVQERVAEAALSALVEYLKARRGA